LHRAFEEKIFEDTGAMVMGRRMFDLGVEPCDNSRFPMAVFVVTHKAHEPIIKKGHLGRGGAATTSVVESGGVIHLRYSLLPL